MKEVFVIKCHSINGSINRDVYFSGFDQDGDGTCNESLNRSIKYDSYDLAMQDVAKLLNCTESFRFVVSICKFYMAS